MPDVLRDFKFITNPNFAFVSALSGRSPLTFYSSITVPRARMEAQCTKCGIQGMTQEELNEFLLDIANSTPEARFRSPYFDAGGADFTYNLPEILPLDETPEVYDCEICGFNSLQDWADSQGFPTSDSGSLPLALSGANTLGATFYGDIASDGTYFGRTGSGNLGFPFIADVAYVMFEKCRQNFELTYTYVTTAGAKHSLVIKEDSLDFQSSGMIIGSWSSNNNNTIGHLSIGATQDMNTCFYQYPPQELIGFPQGNNVIRTRTIRKEGDTITFSDSGMPNKIILRCWAPLRGWLGLRLGPGVKVRNLSLVDI